MSHHVIISTDGVCDYSEMPGPSGKVEASGRLEIEVGGGSAMTSTPSLALNAPPGLLPNDSSYPPQHLNVNPLAQHVSPKHHSLHSPDSQWDQDLHGTGGAGVCNLPRRIRAATDGITVCPTRSRRLPFPRTCRRKSMILELLQSSCGPHTDCCVAGSLRSIPTAVSRL